ncbi:MAG: DUF3492 domain-containing protein, partial [Vulcanimicrobiota bacterium]
MSTCADKGSKECVSDWLLAGLTPEQKTRTPDICLFIEGTYPYISGGVSSWVHDLINYFDKYSFSIIHLAANSSEILDFKYQLPPNVINYDEIYLYDFPRMSYRTTKASEAVENYLNQIYLYVSKYEEFEQERLAQVIDELGAFENFKVKPEDLFVDKAA